MHLTFSFPSPSHLSRGLRCFETAPAGGRQTPFLPVGSPCCPACGQGPKPTARETKGRFSLSFINLHFFLLCGPRVIFYHTLQKAGDCRWHCDIWRYWEGGCVLGGARSISWVFLFVWGVWARVRCKFRIIQMLLIFISFYFSVMKSEMLLVVTKM